MLYLQHWFNFTKLYENFYNTKTLQKLHTLKQKHFFKLRFFCTSSQRCWKRITSVIYLVKESFSCTIQLEHSKIDVQPS